MTRLPGTERNMRDRRVRLLRKFVGHDWARAVVVGTSNDRVRAVVAEGLLDKRIGSMPSPLRNAPDLPIAEYRLTPAGEGFLKEHACQS